MIAFEPQGAVFTFTAASSAPTSVQAISLNGVGATDYLLSNLSATIGAVIGFGNSDTVAKLNAAAGSTESNCIVILPNQSIVVSGPVGAYFSGISTSSTAVIYVQAGKAH